MTELERRRQLARLTRAELIDWVIQIEQAPNTATQATQHLRTRIQETP